MFDRVTPIDPARIGELKAVEVSASIDRKTGEQREFDGVPSWNVQVLRTPPATADGFQPQAELGTFALNAEKEPKITPLSPIEVINPVERKFQNGGSMLSAEDIKPAGSGGPAPKGDL